MFRPARRGDCSWEGDLFLAIVAYAFTLIVGVGAICTLPFIALVKHPDAAQGVAVPTGAVDFSFRGELTHIQGLVSDCFALLQNNWLPPCAQTQCRSRHWGRTGQCDELARRRDITGEPWCKVRVIRIASIAPLYSARNDLHTNCTPVSDHASTCRRGLQIFFGGADDG